MSARVKFLDDLKRKAQSSHTVPKKKCLHRSEALAVSNGGGVEDNDIVKTQENSSIMNSNLPNKVISSADPLEFNGFKKEIKQERFSVDDIPYLNQSGDEDLSFLMSLLPHIRSIPTEMKLRFRNRINEVVDEFAYSSIIKS